MCLSAKWTINTALSHYTITPRGSAHRLIVLECSFEFAQCHVGGGPPVVAFDVVLVHLQRPGGVGQRVAITLGAQVGQATITVEDGIGRVQLNCLWVVLDCVLIVFLCKTNKNPSGKIKPVVFKKGYTVSNDFLFRLTKHSAHKYVD